MSACIAVSHLGSLMIDANSAQVGRMMLNMRGLPMEDEDTSKSNLLMSTDFAVAEVTQFDTETFLVRFSGSIECES